MGRSRKKGDRYKNGRLKVQQETDWHRRERVGKRICAQLGMAPTLDNLQQAVKYGGTFWGLLYLGGAIDLRQHSAAEEFAKMLGTHDRDLGLPKRTPGSVNLLTAGVRSGASGGEDNRTCAIELYEALRAHVGPMAEAILIDCALERCTNIPDLQDALSSVADHLKMPQIEKAA